MPQRIHEAYVELEKHLETWIEANPDLLEIGLRLVGRQVHTVAGPIDLLGRDPQGQWTIIEIKRGQATRQALAQAIDYAAAIAELSNEDLASAISAHPAKQAAAETPATKQDDAPGERAIRIILVGVGSDPGLHRVVDFLSTRFQVPITVVVFSVFEVAGAGRILLRELSDSEGATPPASASMPPIADHVQKADLHDMGDAFQSILNVARRVGLRQKSFKHSVMFAPASNGNRSLFTVWDTPEEPGKLTFWIGTETFEQFFGTPQETVIQHLGPGDWQKLSADEVRSFVAGLEALIASTAMAGDDSNADSNLGRR